MLCYGVNILLVLDCFKMYMYMYICQITIILLSLARAIFKIPRGLIFAGTVNKFQSLTVILVGHNAYLQKEKYNWKWFLLLSKQNHIICHDYTVSVNMTVNFSQCFHLSVKSKNVKNILPNNTVIMLTCKYMFW